MNAMAAVMVTAVLAPPGEPGRDELVRRSLHELHAESFDAALVQNEARFVDLSKALLVNGWLRARFPDNPVGLSHRALILEGLERPAEALVPWDAEIARLQGGHARAAAAPAPGR